MADEGKAQALKNLLLAQEFYQTKYEQFKKDLAISGIPLDFSNQKFLEQLLKFSENFETFLKEQKEPPAPPEVMGAVAPRELIDSILQNAPVIASEIDKAKQQRVRDLAGEFARKVQGMARVKNMPELEKRLFTEFSGITAKNSREFGEKMELAFARVIATAAQSEKFGSQAKQIAKEVVKNSQKELEVITSPTPSQEEITEAMLKSDRPDLWFKTYKKLSAIEPNPTFEVVDRLTRVAEALHATPPEGVSYNVFSRVDVGGLQKPVQGVLGAALSFVPHAREKIFASGWAAATKLEKAQERFGRLIVESPVFTQAVERGNKVFGVSRARNFVWDLASSLAGPPVAADVFVLEVLGLAPESYSMTQVQAANSHSHSPFHLIFSEAAGWGLRKGAAAVAKKAGWKIGAGLGARFGSFFGGIFGALIGAFFGGGLGSLFGKKQPGPPSKWYDNPLVLVPILFVIIIAALPLLFYFKQVAEFGTFNEELGGEDVGGSRYIHVTKTANQTSFPDNNAQSVTYTITVEATEQTLTSIAISETITAYGKSGNLPPPDAPKTIPVGGDIVPGKPFTYQFTVPLGVQFKDALIVNTVTVKADAGDAKGEQSIASAVITIGNPPAACFVPADSGPADTCGSGGSPTNWGDDWNMVIAASQNIAQYPGIVAASGCMANPITVYRVRRDYGGGCFSNGAIYLYNGGVSSFGTAVYTLSHELGHAIDHGSSCFEDFHSQNIYNREGYGGEGGLPTYPNANSEHEDFAETIGLYIGHLVYYPSKWSAYPKYPGAYPLHYNFADSLNKGTLSCSK